MHSSRQCLFLHLVMNLVQPVKCVEVWRLRHPLLLVCVYLYHAGNVLGSGLQNCFLKRSAADVFDEQIRYQELCLRQFFNLVHKVDMQALQYA